MGLYVSSVGCVRVGVAVWWLRLLRLELCDTWCFSRVWA